MEQEDLESRGHRWESSSERTIVLGVLITLGALIALSVLIPVGIAVLMPIVAHFAPSPTSLATIDGPEQPKLLDDVHGWLLVGEYGPTLTVVSLPERTVRDIPLKGRPWYLSHPDAQGRLAYVCDSPHSGYAVRITDVAGSNDRVLYEASGNVQWNGLVNFVALSPKHGRLLISSREEEGPDAFRSTLPHELCVWDIDTNTHVDLASKPCTAATWLPDSRRVVLEVLVPPDEVPNHERVPPKLADVPVLAIHVGHLPSVQLFDVDTGESTWIAWGSRPCLSPDGSKVAYAVARDHWVLRDLSTGECTRLNLPGELAGPEALLSDRLALYPASATTGSDPGVLRTFTKMPQAKWTMKVADIDSADFVTVVPSVGRFQLFAFGVRGR